MRVPAHAFLITYPRYLETITAWQFVRTNPFTFSLGAAIKYWGRRRSPP